LFLVEKLHPSKTLSSASLVELLNPPRERNAEPARITHKENRKKIK
jgi:hypothetical protein